MKRRERDIKNDLIRIFTTLLHFHSTLGSRGNIATKYRISSYSKILSTLEKFEAPIYSSEDVKDIPNIGKSTFEKIDLIAKTGTHPLYEEILKNKEYQILLQFQDIRGIGPQKAYQIYKSGYRSVDQYRKDVLDGVVKTDIHLKASLLYMNDLKQKISHNEITLFTRYLENTFQMKLINSGSYRMGKSKSGDIDLLCVIKNSSEIKSIIKKLKSIGLFKHIYNESINHRIQIKNIH
jgi:DNA polymerase/3'-5' exonuclease PolX